MCYVLFFVFLDFDHIEFTLGGDPSLPLRVLVSVPKPSSEFDEMSGSETSSSDASVAIDVVPIVDHHLKFMESSFAPAVLKLFPKSVSRMKGAGNPTMKKWYIQQSAVDWLVEVGVWDDKIAADLKLSEYYL